MIVKQSFSYSQGLNNSCLGLVTLTCCLRKSSLKHILTLFIQWNFNFIEKVVLRETIKLANWLIHPTGDYSTF